MKEFIATYNIVTPMFIGGADQTPDGVRPSSVKGVLRFWWRALNWGRFWGQSVNNEVSALQNLHEEEARLFGSSMEGNSGGQGCFLLSVTQQKNYETIDSWPPDDPNHTASYMAYGLLSTKSDNHRFAIKEKTETRVAERITEFTVKILFKKNTAETDYQQIKSALEAWSMFGGLGGRSRRAMGSVTLVSLNDSDVLLTKDNYEQRVKNLLDKYENIPKAPFTAFNQDSLCSIGVSGKNARRLVEEEGSKYKKARSEIVKPDENKIPFGLPLKTKTININDRRSSPLFFHIHQLQNKNYVAANLLLPTRIFHPDERYSTTSMAIVEQFMSVK